LLVLLPAAAAAAAAATAADAVARPLPLPPLDGECPDGGVPALCAATGDADAVAVVVMAVAPARGRFGVAVADPLPLPDAMAGTCGDCVRRPIVVRGRRRDSPRILKRRHPRRLTSSSSTSPSRTETQQLQEHQSSFEHQRHGRR